MRGTNTYDLVENPGDKRATLRVGPAAHEPSLFAGTVQWVSRDGIVRLSPYLVSPTSAEDAKAKALDWVRKNLFADFIASLRPEPW